MRNSYYFHNNGCENTIDLSTIDAKEVLICSTLNGVCHSFAVWFKRAPKTLKREPNQQKDRESRARGLRVECWLMNWLCRFLYYNYILFNNNMDLSISCTLALMSYRADRGACSHVKFPSDIWLPEDEGPLTLVLGQNLLVVDSWKNSDTWSPDEMDSWQLFSNP